MATTCSNTRDIKSASLRRKMPFSSPAHQEAVANQLLKDAMSDERSKRWAKVVQSYRRLLRMLNKENLPHDFDPPNWFRMLMYECHYHLGLALQNIGEHKRAVAQYTKALEAIFIPKNGCTAGCHTNSCLMVPLYTRRAFAYSKTGDLKASLKDAEKAVVLDCNNPDVYCIRALVRSTRKEERLSLADVEEALTHNPKHLCALILRGTLVQPLGGDEWDSYGIRRVNKDHDKACSINPDCHNYLSVQDFHHPEILSFYDRFLYSLNVPHTVSEVDLVSIAPAYINNTRPSSPTSTVSVSRPSSQHSTYKSVTPCVKKTSLRIKNMPPSPIPGRNDTDLSIYNQPIIVVANPMKFKQETLWNQNGIQPFRCGTKLDFTKAQQVLFRRKEYGLAVQEYVNRPKTASDYMEYLEKERQKKQREEQRNNRAQTAMSNRSNISETSKMDRISANLRTNLTFDGSNKRTRTTQTMITTQPATTVNSKKIKVFENVNVSDAPRMYYRPWLGDKLPVAEIEKKEAISPPFRP